MNVESNPCCFTSDNSQTDLRTGSLRWKRFCLMTWPALMSLGLAVRFYFTEIHATLSWLIQNRHPMGDWMSYFEFYNQILLIIALLLLTLLLLFQRRIGVILFLLGTTLFTVGNGIGLVEYHIF